MWVLRRAEQTTQSEVRYRESVVCVLRFTRRFLPWSSSSIGPAPRWLRIPVTLNPYKVWPRGVFMCRQTNDCSSTCFVCFNCILLTADGPQRARLPIPPTATLPSFLCSRRIFPSLHGSRLTSVYQYCTYFSNIVTGGASTRRKAFKCKAAFTQFWFVTFSGPAGYEPGIISLVVPLFKRKNYFNFGLARAVRPYH